MILTDEQIEDLNFICYKLQKISINMDKAILVLRSKSFYDLIIYIFNWQQENSFQNIMLPYMDLTGWCK